MTKTAIHPQSFPPQKIEEMKVCTLSMKENGESIIIYIKFCSVGDTLLQMKCRVSIADVLKECILECKYDREQDDFLNLAPIPTSLQSQRVRNDHLSEHSGWNHRREKSIWNCLMSDCTTSRLRSWSFTNWEHPGFANEIFEFIVTVFWVLPGFSLSKTPLQDGLAV